MAPANGVIRVLQMNPDCAVCTDHAKQGLGSATMSAAHLAIQQDYELFVTLDADWSHHPKHLPDLSACNRACRRGYRFALHNWWSD